MVVKSPSDITEYVPAVSDKVINKGRESNRNPRVHEQVNNTDDEIDQYMKQIRSKLVISEASQNVDEEVTTDQGARDDRSAPAAESGCAPGGRNSRQK